MNAITRKAALNEGMVPWGKMSKITQRALKDVGWDNVDARSSIEGRWNPVTRNGAFYSGRPVASDYYRIRPLVICDEAHECTKAPKAKPQPPKRTVIYTKADGRQIRECLYNQCNVHDLRKNLIQQREAANSLAACIREYNKYAKKEGWELA